MGHGQRLLHPPYGLVGIAQHPQGHGDQGAKESPVVPYGLRESMRGRVLLGVAEGNPLLIVGTGGGKGSYNG